MRRRTLTYADAVRLIGAPESPAVKALGNLAGAGAAVITVKSAGTVDFFALRDQLVKWGHTAVAGVRDKIDGLDRFSRTERLLAAHAVLVVTAFFEAQGEAGVDLDAAELTAREQAALLTGGGLADDYRGMVRSLIDCPLPVPTPTRPGELIVEDLMVRYNAAEAATRRFLSGLEAFADAGWEPVAAVAYTRYTERFRMLAADVPEFRVWSSGVDAQATRETVRASAADLKASLAELRAAVRATVSGLTTHHRAQLTKPILAADRAPDHVTLPSLGAGYVRPRGRVAEAGPQARPDAEDWWNDSRPVEDVPDLLLAHLGTAVDAPTVVLGHPGSGKSALTRILAAELTEAGFLAVRVELRSVPGDASIQRQIEDGVQQMLGESVTWPDVVRGAAGSPPVVILDGFDELLQAGGLNRADYLELVQEFQSREADLGRPVAVLVTSRTVVADRARFPRHSVVVRLDAFDPDQVGRWLGIWNTANEPGLRARELRPLPPEVALAQGELASQPLLLLLLALYDAGRNALQRAGAGIGRVELYERLFADFVAREVDKGPGSRPSEQREAEIAREWRRLGAVALALLNRGGEVIRDVELDRDVPSLLSPDDLAVGRADARGTPLTVSQLLVGRFFFIHEARAGALGRGFEFLHATFGDYLAARLIVAALRELALERRDRRRAFRGSLDAGFLYAATSFVTVTRRAPLWEFVQGLTGALSDAERRSCRELVLELLPEAGFPQPRWSVADYEPIRKPFAARHAAFSANLVCFAVLLADAPVRTDELAPGPSPSAWRDLALLWESQLDPEDRGRIWQRFRVAWRFDDDRLAGDTP